MDPPHQHKKKIIFAFLHELVQNCKIVKKTFRNWKNFVLPLPFRKLWTFVFSNEPLPYYVFQILFCNLKFLIWPLSQKSQCIFFHRQPYVLNILNWEYNYEIWFVPISGTLQNIIEGFKVKITERGTESAPPMYCRVSRSRWIYFKVKIVFEYDIEISWYSGLWIGPRDLGNLGL